MPAAYLSAVVRPSECSIAARNHWAIIAMRMIA
jgi:hypothetical protein